MKINAFFANRLGVPLYNHVWSWGAHDTANKRIYLRVSERSVVDDTNGQRWVIVYDPSWIPSSGHGERKRHIEAMRNGVRGYAVTAQFNDANKIAAFDDETLLILGDIVQEDGLTYARVTGTVPVDEVVQSGADFTTAAADVDELLHSKVPVTQRKALIAARLGQGAFRAGVLRSWDYRCAVTGVAVSAAIRASHIKPWRASSNADRLNPQNGLPLVATLDALFDAGLISFDQNGRMLVSSEITASGRKQLGLRSASLREAPSKPTAAFLLYHREECFQP